MTKVTPLLQRSEDAPLAWLSQSLPGLSVSSNGQLVSNSQFLSHVHRVADSLPDTRHVVNMCDNRYLFLVTAWAAIVRDQTNLLPPNKNVSTQKNLVKRYKDSCILHDGNMEIFGDATSINVAEQDWSLSEYGGDCPQIALDHLAIISFTSGSTGDSKPNMKSWQTLQESSRINARYMLPNDSDVFYHLATVPGQHMWGLETSVLLPVFANACLVDARPMYPRDMLDLLAQLPQPRALISTPLHLRALLGTQELAQSPPPELSNVLCATAPLDQALAGKFERRFSTNIREVYGCSEVGSMSVRRTSQTDVWTAFDGLDFSQDVDGKTSVCAAHLPATIELEDSLNMVGNNQFTLSGRISDQIKIAGKRGSLHEVNSVLAKFEGFQDGVVFFPVQDRPIRRLVAIVSLVDGASKHALREHFREFVDSAFVPRPIYVVDALPREENGKLNKEKLQSFYESLKVR